MSGRSRNTAIVMRNYRPAPDNCARALELLLKKSVRKKAAEPTSKPDGRDDVLSVRNTEEVSHVDQRPERPSEIFCHQLTRERTQK